MTKVWRLVHIFLIAVISGGLLAACDGEVLPATSDWREGKGKAVIAIFDVRGEKFNVRLVDPVNIRKVVAVWEGEVRSSVPSGVIRLGPGEDAHNKPWGWHLGELGFEMTKNPLESCDGLPSGLPNGVRASQEESVRYCPKDAILTNLLVIDEDGSLARWGTNNGKSGSTETLKEEDCPCEKKYE